MDGHVGIGKRRKGYVGIMENEGKRERGVGDRRHARIGKGEKKEWINNEDVVMGVLAENMLRNAKKCGIWVNMFHY